MLLISYSVLPLQTSDYKHAKFDLNETNIQFKLDM